MAELLRIQLEEIQLIQYSLLPDEHLEFIDNQDFWLECLQKISNGDRLPTAGDPISFRVRLKGAHVWFETTLACNPTVSVKGENISRREQEKWQTIISDKLHEVADSQFQVYQVLSLHLLPLLHEELDSSSNEFGSVDLVSPRSSSEERYHVLFTSHHLISPEKRRCLQRWSTSLALSGFSKVGYPGIIYAEGDHKGIADFVTNVKSMQWLALKTRFVDPLPSRFWNEESRSQGRSGKCWKEFLKIGEVMEEMKRLGREQYVIDMGIGSSS